MPEVICRAIPIEINYACDDCIQKPNGGCLLKGSGQVFTCHPPLYGYTCPNCNKKYQLDGRYPRIEYKYYEDY